MKILAIIPARGGSKGIPRKNLADIKGKPLIWYTIGPAIRAAMSELVLKVIVSTDDPEIAAIAEMYGAEVPFLRPAEIACDQSKSIDLILHALNYYSKAGVEFDAVLLLQPTSPMRAFEDIQRAIKAFDVSGGDSLISVYQEEYINELVTYHEDGAKGIPVSPNHNKGVRRQDHAATFVRNGAIYLAKVSYIKSTNQIISDTPILYKMPKSRSFNIDTEEDLEMVKCLL